ncbi:MAG: putative collagen-binding domain-containing protein, partial [Terracidiphilus sp.]
YGVVQQKLLDDYNKPTMSYILMEATYEGEHNSTEVQIRRQAYWSILSGAFGHVFGNNLIWRFDGPFHTTVASAVPLKGTWQQAMDLPGSVAMMYWGRFFHSRAWYDLVPDQDHVVVTKGLGEETGTDYLAAARTSDGSTVIAYMPTSRTITVDMSKISGAQATGWWFNPRTGQATTAGTFPTSGMKEFSPPAEGDWALVLDDASKQRPAPGTVQ